MWPDVSEYAPDDLCDVPGLKLPDGSSARLYSAFRKGPVLLHTKWMRQYGIDGIFVSRFIGEAASPTRSRHVNRVLANLREGCHREGRVWAMMLDLSVGRSATTKMVMDDWKFLCDQVKVREDSRYLHHQGKPVVLLWGLGFKDRPWSPEQGAELVEFFKNDSKYGGVYLIGGVDPFWRTLRGESRPDEGWSKVYHSFDAISPWDAGRYRDDASMDRIRKQVWEGDLAELRASGKGYMPTAFPDSPGTTCAGCRLNATVPSPGIYGLWRAVQASARFGRRPLARVQRTRLQVPPAVAHTNRTPRRTQRGLLAAEQSGESSPSRPARFKASALTSSQDTTSSGAASSAASRRSSSSLRFFQSSGS